MPIKAIVSYTLKLLQLIIDKDYLNNYFLIN